MRQPIIKLDESERKWWQSTIRKFRSEMISEPKFYIDQVVAENRITNSQIKNDVELLLVGQREEIYDAYLIAEAELNAKVLDHLIQARDLPRDLFVEEILSKVNTNSSGIEFEFLSNLVSQFTGGIFPYIYELSLSNTNSRRSRAGSTFEQLVEKCLEVFDYPFQNQSHLGKEFFATNRIGKKVDLIIPGKSEYLDKRSLCAIVSVKTSLRERWQEVVEELQRSNVPHIYLATLDEGISGNQIDIMKEYNITLIVRTQQKNSKFKDHGNVESFQHFFDSSVPHILSAW